MKNGIEQGEESESCTSGNDGDSCTTENDDDPSLSTNQNEARQFGGTNLQETICRQAHLSASQFGGKINKNYLPLLPLK